MAQFYAYMRGSRGPASRLGTRQSGITITTKSWEGEVNVSMWTDGREGRDYVRVTLGRHGHGDSVTLYNGPCDGWQEYDQAGELGKLAWVERHIPLQETDLLQE